MQPRFSCLHLDSFCFSPFQQTRVQRTRINQRPTWLRLFQRPRDRPLRSISRWLPAGLNPSGSKGEGKKKKTSKLRGAGQDPSFSRHVQAKRTAVEFQRRESEGCKPVPSPPAWNSPAGAPPTPASKGCSGGLLQPDAGGGSLVLSRPGSAALSGKGGGLGGRTLPWLRSARGGGEGRHPTFLSHSSLPRG